MRQHQSVPWCPSHLRRLQPGPSAATGRQSGKPLDEAQKLKSPMKTLCSVPLTTRTQTSSVAGSPSTVSQSSSDSSQESLTSPPRAPLNASVLDLHRPVSISPPTTISSMEPYDPPFDPPIGYTGGEASKPQRRPRGSDKPQESTTHVSKPDEMIGMSMDELEDIGRWMADTREELKSMKGVGKLLGESQSRLSSILQGLSTGTFDEDKYIITRRVDQHIDKIFSNNVDNAGKPIPSAEPSVAPRPATPADSEAWPATAHAPSPLHHPQLIKPRISLPSHPPPHPPPLFMHSFMNRGPSDPREPLQHFGIKWDKVTNKLNTVQSTNRAKDKLQSNNAVGKKILNSAHDIRVVSENEKMEESSRVCKVPLFIGKAKGTVEDMKDKLQISSQTSVDIPGENIAVALPGISIMPSHPPPNLSLIKHKIISVVHESMDNDDQLSERNGSQANNDHSDNNDRYNRELDDEASRAVESDNINVVVEGPSLNVAPDVEGPSLNVAPDVEGPSLNVAPDVEGPSLNVAPDVEGLLPPLVCVADMRLEDDGSHQLHTDEDPHKTEVMSKSKPDGYLIDFDDGREKGLRKQGPIVNGGVNNHGAFGGVDGMNDGVIGSGDASGGDASGGDASGGDHEQDMLPEVRWEEVVVKEYEEEDENTTHMVLEAEDRLCQHQLKLRIMQRLEEVLRGVVQVEHTPVEHTPVEHTPVEHTPAVVPGAQVELFPMRAQEDYQFQDVVMATRSVLEGLVQERFDAAFSQVRNNPEGPTDLSEGAPTSISCSSNMDKSRSSSELKTPLKSHNLSPEPSLLERIRTPSPSPPPKETISPRKMLTPQLSHEDVYNSEEAVTTPPPSPVPIFTMLDNKYPQTPSVTPESSPSKVKKIVTPECTPKDTINSGNVVQQLDTPVQSPTPQQVPDEVILITRIPTPRPSEISQTHLKLPESDSAASFISYQNLEEKNFPRVQDQSTQVYMPARRPKHREDEESVFTPEEGRSLLSPDTPSVICQSSADVTLSSSVEATDVTCYTVSEGEVLNGATSVDMSLEAGEVASSGYLQLLACGNARTRAYINNSAVPNKVRKQHSESEIVRSEGELELDESSERLSIMEKRHNGTDEQESSEESQVEVLQGDQRTPDDSLQVSVVHNESYSSGDAITLSTDELSRLRQENEELLLRLSNLGSFSFLARNFQSFHS